MGFFQNLSVSWSQTMPRFLGPWVDAVSAFLDNLAPGGGFQANTVYVSVNGNDATGDGSFDKPFLTIAKAMSTITTATQASPWVVQVGPGTFATNFTIKPNVYVIGAGSGTAQYVGAPLTAVTIVNPNPAQVLDASFAGAGVKPCGIFKCGFSSIFLADFNAIGSTGQGTFDLDDILTENSITFTGVAGAGNVGNVCRMKDVYLDAFINITIANMGGSDISNLTCDQGGGLIYTQSAAIASFHNIVGALISTLTATWTSAAIANNMNIDVQGLSAQFVTAVTLTGKGVALTAPGVDLSLAMPDAATRLGWGSDNASTLTGVSAGRNIIHCTPGAARVLTVSNGTPSGLSATELVIVNQSTGFPIDLSFAVGAVSAGSPTYVPPSSTVTILYDPNNGGAGTWYVEPYTQAGSAALTNGVSAKILADVTANSRILATWKASNGAAGVPLIPAADRTIGTRAGGGGFKIHSAALATGADVATDQGTYDWHIVNDGG